MTTECRVKDFIDNDLKIFSNLDNVRSIPSLIDGFKDSQRKAVFALLKHGSEKIKVSQLGAYAGMVTHYNHGEVSMCDTIVNLAQNFTGSNNINLFEPMGQFGSILSSESSAHRYIYTKPSKYLRQYFSKDDDAILVHREEEGEILEPLYYLPLLPMWLVNGTKGIGTGHASTILSRSPQAVLDLVSKLVRGVSVQQKTIDTAMTPYFEGWKGKIEKRDGDDSKWEMCGTLEKVNSTTIRITELPVSYDLDKFKGILIDLLDDGKIKDFESGKSSEKGFHFEITAAREIVKKTQLELENMFKLRVGVGENVTLWDTEGKLRRYANAYEALQDFLAFRLAKYQPRKDKMLEDFSEAMDWLRAKASFISLWNQKIDKPHLKKSTELRDILIKEGIREIYIDRLLSMQISSLTLEKALEHKELMEKIQKEFDELKVKTTEQLYLEDLAKL